MCIRDRDIRAFRNAMQVLRNRYVIVRHLPGSFVAIKVEMVVTIRVWKGLPTVAVSILVPDNGIALKLVYIIYQNARLAKSPPFINISPPNGIVE